MGVSSSHGTARPRRTRRTIWFTFAAMVAGPVACLVVLWGLILGGVLGGARPGSWAEGGWPGLGERLRGGEKGGVPAELTLQLRTKTAEVASAEAAIASLQHTAAAAAAGEAGLRNGIGQVFVSLARRNQ